MEEELHIKTPLIKSDKLTGKLNKGQTVYLKLENLQPSGSFKIRGIGATCQEAKKSGAKRIVGSSGGNAGMAMAYAAKKLGMEATLFLPTTTPQMMVDKIKEESAEVVVTGENWNAANAEAVKFLNSDPEAFFVHPYDQETTWKGHATVVHEIKEQLGARPAAIVTVVGGGGLATGILLGLEEVGWEDVPLVTMETEGSNCFQAAIEAGKVVKIKAIHSVATSLGALSVCQRLFHLKDRFKVRSGLVSDRDAISACLKFCEDHRMMVEPACGAALAAVYNETPFKNPLSSVDDDRPVVVIVCGGNLVSMDLLHKFKAQIQINGFQMPNE